MTSKDRETRLQRAFATEVLRGLRLGFRARLFSLGVIAVWLGVQNPFPDFVYFWALLAAFILLVWFPYKHHQRGGSGSWYQYAYPLGDMVLLTFMVLFPNTLSDQLTYPAQVAQLSGVAGPGFEPAARHWHVP